MIKQTTPTLSGINTDQLFNKIMAAPSDVSSLTTFELLRRDLKIVGVNGTNVAFAVIPEPLAAWKTRDTDWAKNIRVFAMDKFCSIVAVMTIFTDHDNNGRGQILLAAGDPKDNAKIQTLVSAVIKHNELGLRQIRSYSDNNTMVAFDQNQLQDTRKAWIPLIQEWFNIQTRI